jgi:hypothetical protein
MASEVNWELCDAAESGDVADIERLIAAGADPNAADVESTPLQAAAANGHIAAIAALLAVGARVNGAGRSGSTPLLLAASCGHAAAVTALLAAGADVHRADSRIFTALHWASREGHFDAARVLLEAGARTDVRNKYGERPIDVVSCVAYTKWLRAFAILLHVARCRVALCRRAVGPVTSPMRPPCVRFWHLLHPGPAGVPSRSPATGWNGSGRRKRGWGEGRSWMRDVTHWRRR